jgi:hypothetical protein
VVGGSVWGQRPLSEGSQCGPDAARGSDRAADGGPHAVLIFSI